MSHLQNLAVGSVVCISIECAFGAMTMDDVVVRDIFEDSNGDVTIYGDGTTSVCIKSKGVSESYDADTNCIWLEYDNGGSVAIQTIL